LQSFCLRNVLVSSADVTGDDVRYKPQVLPRGLCAFLCPDAQFPESVWQRRSPFPPYRGVIVRDTVG
jgi:hypothetical protein